MADDWDLYAIVRSCSSAPNANRNTVPSSGHASLENHLDCLASLTFDDDGDPFAFPNLAQPRNNGLQELQDSYKPFLSRANIGQDNILSSFVSDFGGFSTGQNQSQQAQQQQHNHRLLQLQQEPPTKIGMSISHVHQPPQQQKPNQRLQLHQQEPQRPGNNSSALPLRIIQSQPPRSRKKKSHQNRLVVHVPAENLSNDVWAWRKYGQKPIKGSPYPRNYYRCSSSKGCAARKQVERSNTDPGMFIVSYTGDHTHPRPTHRNSLAGSTRSKFPAFLRTTTKESEASSPEKAAPSSSPVSGNSLSPTTPQSAPVDREAADENIKTETPAGKEAADDMEAQGMETDDDGDDNNDVRHEDEDDILIPNMALNEDLIKGLQLQELGSSASQESNSGGLNNFADNFSSWAVGCSNPSSPTAGGGCRAAGKKRFSFNWKY